MPNIWVFIFIFESATIVSYLYFKHGWPKILKGLNFIKKKNLLKQCGNIVKIHFPLFDAHSSPWWRFRRVLSVCKEHCQRGLWSRHPVRLQGLMTERASASHTALPRWCSIQARQLLHTCLLCTGLPPTVHIASCWNLPAARHPYVRCKSSSALLGSPICSRTLFSPDSHLQLQDGCPPPAWSRGTNHVSTQLDCELLQRDLGHSRLESQHYSLPDSWLATNMCCCWFFF